MQLDQYGHASLAAQPGGERTTCGTCMGWGESGGRECVSCSIRPRRCLSCDHLLSFHTGPEGCRYGVSATRVDSNTVCPCAAWPGEPSEPQISDAAGRARYLDTLRELKERARAMRGGILLDRHHGLSVDVQGQWLVFGWEAGQRLAAVGIGHGSLALARIFPVIGQQPTPQEQDWFRQGFALHRQGKPRPGWRA